MKFGRGILVNEFMSFSAFESGSGLTDSVTVFGLWGKYLEGLFWILSCIVLGG
jgi:hypothetical protein